MHCFHRQFSLRETLVAETEPVARLVKMLIRGTLIAAGAYFAFLYLLANR
jgi:hypothetical protein